MLFVLSLALAGMTVTQQVDTVVPVKPGTRLQVENFNGETTIRTWDKQAIRIVADGDDRNRIEIRNLGSLLTVKAQSRYGAPRSVDYDITVPARTDISTSGVNNDVTISGVQGGISVETVNGSIDVRGGDGFISLKSVEGDVVLEDAKGRVTLSSVNESVRATNITGDLSVDAVNGDVTLQRINSSSVSATTVNGEIIYDGTIQDGGQYSLNTHNGDVDVTVSQGANATVEVGTFNGEFDAGGIPVMVSRTSRNRFTFVLGSGAAHMSLESFSGTIRLHRPGDLDSRVRNRDMHRNQQKNKNRGRDY